MVDGLFVELLPESGWRYMLGLAALPGLAMFFGFLSLPESPRWLAQKGRVTEAQKVLQSLRDSDDEAEAELADIVQSVAEHRDSDESDDEDENDNTLDDDDQQLSSEYGGTTGHATRSPPPPYQHHHHTTLYRLGQMLADHPTRRALVLGCGLMAVQQLSGINTVMYYAGSIYEMSGFTEVTAVWLSGFTALGAGGGDWR